MFHPSFLRLYMFSRYLVAALVLSSVSACVINAGPSEQRNDKPPVSQIVKVKDLAPAIEQAKGLPLHSTLVVFDIDDTLLTATEFFGSDKWYDWQRGRALDPFGEPLVIAEADKVSCLFDTLGITYEIAKNRPTQANMASLVKQVNNDLLILTARSGAYRAATKRELNYNGLDFGNKALTPVDVGYHYDFSHAGRSANVSYVDGVFMVQGMDKGVMLLDLLARTNRNYEAVIFVDDKTKNINDMANALQNAGIDFYGFHYVKIDKTVSSAEVTEAQAAAGDLTKLLNKHFVERAELIEVGQCAY
ncbi:MAG: prepilin-type processing-associated H-X9-DG protein [Paraglaciecola sp.]|jgi:prepilin-type processing-associated H-X9-DG protein